MASIAAARVDRTATSVATQEADLVAAVIAVPTTFLAGFEVSP